MKKVLFLTYYWPPSGGSGVQRPLKFVKYLRDFGWEPIVYTVENGEFPEIDNSLIAEIPENITVLKKSIFEPFAIYKWFTGKKKKFTLVAGYMHQKKSKTWSEKISMWIRSNLFIPDARMFWIKPSINYLDNWLKTNQVDAIITTGPPHSVLLIGLGLKRKHKLPWLVDFRDPWTEIDYYKDLNLTNFADNEHKNLEKQVLKYADKVVCVSPDWGEGLARIGNRKVDYISNGFDAEDIHEEIAVNLDSKFSIVHIGMMGKSRNHEVFWNVISQIIKENEGFKNDIEIKLFGKCDTSVSESITSNKLDEYAKIFDYVPHSQIVYIQKAAQVLYLSVNETANAKGILTGKIYEYLAVKRPILCIAPLDGEASKVVLDSGAGLVSDFGNFDNLKSNILHFYNNYKNKIAFEGGKDFEKYSRKNQTEQLANLLNEITIKK
ncbi:MAG: glycosyl transferase family 1 [Cytophagales bacterium]|nr:MAG: glycosyl transferase family 1 [Cytophagales bacterium]